MADYREELLRFIASKKAKSTVEQTDRNIGKFQRWLEEKGEASKAEELPPRELDTYIGRYFLDLKQDDGSDYQPDSLTTMHRAIDRYLREHEYGESILTSDEFEVSGKLLESRRKDLKEKGLGNKPNRAEPLTEAEEEKLWESGQLGHDSPEALLNTVWYLNTKLLGFRGNNESRQMLLGDLELKKDENEGEYLEWTERTTKTRTGKDPKGHTRAFNPKIYPIENKARCPVEIYKHYASRRPVEMLAPETDFYLAINYTRRATDFVWFKRSPLGINTLKCMMRKMSEKAGIVGRKTNHSVRKTMCTQLLHRGVPATTIMQLSGHKDPKSINNYAVASREQQRAMSNLLSDPNACLPALPQPGTSSSCLSLPAPQVPSPTMARMLSGPADVESRQTMLQGMFAGAQMSHCSFSFSINPMGEESTPSKVPRIEEN